MYVCDCMLTVCWCVFCGTVYIYDCVVDSVLVCAATEDCGLHIFSTSSGRRLCPAIVLLSRVSQLLCSAAQVMVVTSQANVLVWFVTYV